MEIVISEFFLRVLGDFKLGRADGGDVGRHGMIHVSLFALEVHLGRSVQLVFDQHSVLYPELFVQFAQGAGLLGEHGEELTLEVVPEIRKRERHADPIKMDRKRSNKSQSFWGFEIGSIVPE